MHALALAPSSTLDVVLRNHLANPSLRWRDVTRFDGGGFRATVVARSGGFAADRPFFFEGVDLARFLDDLGKLERLEPGFARLRSSSAEEVLGLQLHARGDVTVFGVLQEHARVAQSLRFAFTTDQTVLAPLRRDLSRCWALPAY
jgi:hypothetical protein